MAMSDTGSSFAQWAALYHHHDDDAAAADDVGIGIGMGMGAAAAASPTSGGSSGSPTAKAAAGAGAAAGQQQKLLHGVEGPRVGKPARRRSRASRRAPVTLLNTDTANFRAMVQQFTGIPAPPAGAFGGAPVINFAADYGFPPPSAVMSFDHHRQQLHHPTPAPLQEQLLRRQHQQQYTGASSPFGGYSSSSSLLQGGGVGGDVFASHGFASSAEDRMLLQSFQAAQMPPLSAAANTSRTNGFFA